jgi:Mn2+/Fe2+ NRAMP family transporter
VLNGVLLPVVLVFVLQLVSKTELMGKYTNSRVYQACAWIITLVITAIVVAMLAAQYWPKSPH